MTLRALPQGLCTWNYRVLDGDRLAGTTEYTVWGESGRLTMDKRELSIERQGPMSGEWVLSGGGREWATAHKPSPFTRRFEIRASERTLVLEAEHPFTRRMSVTAAAEKVGTIAPDHAFTRRATLDFREDVPTEIQLFCLWLAALMWRRAARSNNAGAGAGT